jgi:hypothetical protein
MTGCWRKTSRGNLRLNLIVGFLDACMHACWLAGYLPRSNCFMASSDAIWWWFRWASYAEETSIAEIITPVENSQIMLCIDGVKEAGVDSAHTFCLCSVQQNYPLLVLKNGRLLLRSIWKYVPSIFLAQIPQKPAKIKNLIKKNCTIYSKLLYFLWLLLWVQLPVRVTKDIVETYQLCNPSFRHSEKLNPKRYLTNPSVPEFNNGCDNGNHDLILYYGCVLVNENGTRR